MKKKRNDFIFNIHCCFGEKFIVVILFYFVFLILNTERSYISACRFYGEDWRNYNDYMAYAFSDGYLLILFFPIAALCVSWKLYNFLCCEYTRILKYKSRFHIVYRYCGYASFCAVSLVLCFLVGGGIAGKMLGMRFFYDFKFVLGACFSCVSMILLMLTYLLFAHLLSSNRAGMLAAGAPVIFELLVWKNHLVHLFPYTLFYNIVEQTDIEISLVQKIAFWSLGAALTIGFNLYSIRHVDFNKSRSTWEIICRLVERFPVSAKVSVTILWGFLYAALTYQQNRRIYNCSENFLYLSFRGFSGSQVWDLIFYLGLCLPIWIFVIYYFSKFFNVFSVYVFMKEGSGMRCMNRGILKTAIYSLFYFGIMAIVLRFWEYYLCKESSEENLSQALDGLVQYTDGTVGVIFDFTVFTLILEIFIMILYLLCGRLEIAFLVGIFCHILNVIITAHVSKGKALIPLTQHILLLRSAQYSMQVARISECIFGIILYCAFFFVMKKQQEKIVNSCYVRED